MSQDVLVFAQLIDTGFGNFTVDVWNTDRQIDYTEHQILVRTLDYGFRSRGDADVNAC
jgi:hypothetical protein